MDATTTDPWLTRQQLAERLQLPPKTLDEWAARGIGPRYARIGKYARYRLSDVIAWENEQFVEWPTPPERTAAV
jgi:hypothetical protein